MQEQLRMILEAEAEARQRLETARQQCQFLVAQAEEDGRRRVREARQARDSIIRSEEERLTAAAKERATQIEDAARIRAAAMRALGLSRMERAVQAAVECVMGRAESDDW